MLLSEFLNELYEKVKELSKQKYWFLVPGLLIIVVTLLNGVGIVPEEPYQRLSQNPFITRTDIHFRNNFQETLLLPLAAYFLQLTSRLSFNIFCYLIIVSGYISLAIYIYRRWGALETIIFSTLIITSPLTTILFTWLGMPDGLTIALTIPLLFTNSLPLIFLLAALGSMNHILFLIAAGEIMALRWVSKNGVRLHHLITLTAGGVTGTLLLKGFLELNQIVVAPRSEFLLTRSIWEWAKLNAVHLPLSLFSMFNIQWLAILICFLMFFRWDKWFFLSVSVLFLLNYGVTFFSLDTTRVFSILSTGIFALCLFHSNKLASSHPASSHKHRNQFLQALTLIGLISIFAPRYFSWAGEIHATPFYEFIRYLIR